MGEGLQRAKAAALATRKPKPAPIVHSEVSTPAQASSVAEIEEIPAVAGKKPRPTDVCLHGMEYRFCRVFLCKAMVA